VQLPGYEILKKAGEGGMAEVWIARQTALDRIVAIKTLNISRVRDSELVMRFQSEAKSAAHLNHPGIVQVFDAGRQGEILFYVMEYVPGMALSELLVTRRRLPEKQALKVAEGVAAALAYAWEKAHLVHCDIKPSNILIDQEGTIKVADLGLARIVGRMEYAEEDIIGTPNYIAPERIRGSVEIDFRSDVYSLGATLYQMLTGNVPFGQYTPEEVLQRQVDGYLPDPMDTNPEISADAAWLTEKMMIKDRTARYNSWAEVIADIESIQNGHGLHSERPAAGQSTILRSEKRQRPSQTSRSTAAKRRRPTAAPRVPQKRIVLPKNVAPPRVPAWKSVESFASPPWARITFLLLATLAGYGYLTYLQIRPRQQEKAAPAHGESSYLPPRAVAAGKISLDELNAGTIPAPPTIEPKPAVQQAIPDHTASPQIMESQRVEVRWNDPVFKAAADDFNKALAGYRKFVIERRNVSTLQAAEEYCRRAIRGFEDCRSRAPSQVDMRTCCDQAYHLLADIRQALLTVPLEPSHPSNLRRQPPAEKHVLSLAAGWQMPTRGGGRQMDDLYELLLEHASPSADLQAHPGLVIYGDLTYLMPLKEALSVLGARASGRRSVSGNAFPRNSFFFYDIKIPLEDDFNKVVLVTDTRNQLVAVELVGNSPLENLHLDASLFSDEWSTYDFIRGKTRAGGKWKIAQRVTDSGEVIRIDSELADYDPNGYQGLGSSKVRTSLFLPKPLANLLLYYIDLKRGGISAFPHVFSKPRYSSSLKGINRSRALATSS